MTESSRRSSWRLSLFGFKPGGRRDRTADPEAVRHITKKHESTKVHELSIANSLVTTATEAIRADAAIHEAADLRVSEVHLRLGLLAGVFKDALVFCYDVAAQDTILEGSRLVIEELPVVVFCKACDREVALDGIQRFRCPVCDTPSGDIRQGKELELATIHFEDTTAEAQQTHGRSPGHALNSTKSPS